MLNARRDQLANALAALEADVEIWAPAELCDGLADILALSPQLSLRGWGGDAQLPSPFAGYPVVGMSRRGEAAPRGNRFLGMPSGFSLDAFVDELILVSRGGDASSPLARETLARLRGPIAAYVLTSPG